MKREELENRLSHIDIEMNDHKIDIKQLKQERKQLKKQLEELPKLEVGKWYVSGGCLLCIVEHEEDNDYVAYGFVNDNWVSGYFQIDDKNIATPQEVQTALIKEAKKRGFKEGVTVISTMSGNPMNIEGEWFDYCNEHNSLCLGFPSIFNNGKWATIIEQKKVSISGDFTKEDLEKIIQTEFK